MKVALCHNHYQQAGGEDHCFRAEGDLLEGAGHRVTRVAVQNADLKGKSGARIACSAVWSGTSYGMIRSVLRNERPDVVHFHNTFPQLSPSAWYAAGRERVPVVQTLHNYRLFCTNSLLLRDGKPCEACVGRRVAWPGVRHKCYRDSRAASGAVAAMAAVHRAAGSHARRVAVFVALSEFSRRVFIAGGLPAERIVVKPNFLMHDPGEGRHTGGFALFVGRLSAEKGLTTLLDAWKRLEAPIPLRVVGTGPLEPVFREPTPNVEWLGHAPAERVLELMRDATLLVFPSECYENCPITLLEAFACGLPTVASGHGAMVEMVRTPDMGLHFRPGDAEHLAEVLSKALADEERLATMGRAARREFEARYSPRANLPQILAIYDRARSVQPS